MSITIFRDYTGKKNLYKGNKDFKIPNVNIDNKAFELQETSRDVFLCLPCLNNNALIFEQELGVLVFLCLACFT